MKVSKEFKIGLFVVAVIVVSFFMINYLRGKDILNREIEVSARYETVDGLVSSAPVYIKGYKAGKVIEVSYDSESEDFLVVCSVKKDFRIPEDSRMTIYGVDIMGGKGVRIDLGSSQQCIADGGILSPSSEPALLDGMAAGLEPLMEKLGYTLDHLNETVVSVKGMLENGSIERTMAHLEATMSDIRAISAGIEGKSDELEAFISNLSELSAQLIPIAEKIDGAVDGVDELVASVDGEDIKSVITSFNDLLVNINDPDGTISKLFVDDSVYHSIDDLLKDIDLLVREIKKSPKKYLRISVF